MLVLRRPTGYLHHAQNSNQTGRIARTGHQPSTMEEVDDRSPCGEEGCGRLDPSPDGELDEVGAVENQIKVVQKRRMAHRGHGESIKA